MEQQQEQQQQQPSIRDLLLSLSHIVDAMEESLKTITNGQQQRYEALLQIHRSLGITPTRTTTSMITTVTKTRQNQQRELPPLSTSSKQAKRKEKQRQKRLPEEFIRYPRVRKPNGRLSSATIGGIAAAVRKLADTPQKGDAMIAFLRNTVDKAVQKMRAKTLCEHLVLSWLYQDEGLRDEALEYLVQTATEHKPSIPLALCEGNWMAKHLLVKRWDNAALLEKRKRAYPGKRQQYQQRLKQPKKVPKKQRGYSSSNAATAMEMDSDDDHENSGEYTTTAASSSSSLMYVKSNDDQLGHGDCRE